MEIKRCSNCGAFTTSESNLCHTCENTLTYSNTLLRNYFEENANFDSVETIANAIGLSPSVVQEYMIANHYIDTTTESYKDLPY